MVNISKILKFLTWHGFDEFALAGMTKYILEINFFWNYLYKAKIKLAAAYPYQKNCTKTDYLASSLAS